MTTFIIITSIMLFTGAILALGKYRYKQQQEDLEIVELIREREAKMQASGEKMISQEEMEEYFRQRSLQE